MAQITRASASAIISANLATNVSGNITAADLREVVINNLDSSFNIADDDTDNISEGTTNLFFTSARVSAIVEGYGYVTSAQSSQRTQEILTSNGYLTEAITTAQVSTKILDVISSAGYLTSAVTTAQVSSIVEAYGYVSVVADLNDISNVSATGVIDNQILIWDSAAAQWNTSSIAAYAMTTAAVSTKILDVVSSAGYLTSAVTTAQVSSIVEGHNYVSADQITEYRTSAQISSRIQDILTSNGYLTSAVTTAQVSAIVEGHAYVSADALDARAFVSSSEITEFRTSAQISSRVQDILTSNGYLTSALTTAQSSAQIISVVTSAVNLQDIADVSVTAGITNGQILAWDAADSQWTLADNAAGLTESQVSTKITEVVTSAILLEELVDVSVTAGIADGQILAWDAADSQWTLADNAAGYTSAQVSSRVQDILTSNGYLTSAVTTAQVSAIVEGHAYVSTDALDARGFVSAGTDGYMSSAAVSTRIEEILVSGQYYTSAEVSARIWDIGISNGWNSGGGFDPDVSAIVIGLDASVSASNGVAIGISASVNQNWGVAIGPKAVTKSSNALAVGFAAIVSGFGAVGLGPECIANGNEAIAIGREANASASVAIAIGHRAYSKFLNSITIGASTTAAADHDFILGNSQHVIDVKGTFRVTGSTALYTSAEVSARVQDILTSNGYLTSAITTAQVSGIVEGHAYVSADQITEYRTSAQISSRIQDILTSNGYLTSAVTTAQVSAIVEGHAYVSTDALDARGFVSAGTDGYMSSAAVSTRIQDILTSNGYLTSAITTAQVSSIVEGHAYVSSDALDARGFVSAGTDGYMSSAAVSTRVQDILTSNTYLTSASVETVIASAKRFTFGTITGETELTAAQAGVYLRSNTAGATTVNVPTCASVSIIAGSQYFIRQGAAGQITVSARTGVTLNVPVSTTAVTRGQHCLVTLVKVSSDVWDIAGDLQLQDT